MVVKVKFLRIDMGKIFGNNDEYRSDAGLDIIRTIDDAFVITGYTSVENNRQGLLLKVDNNGNEIWSRAFGVTLKKGFLMFNKLQI